MPINAITKQRIAPDLPPVLSTCSPIHNLSSDPDIAGDADKNAFSNFDKFFASDNVAPNTEITYFKLLVFRKFFKYIYYYI